MGDQATVTPTTAPAQPFRSKGCGCVLMVIAAAAFLTALPFGAATGGVYFCAIPFIALAAWAWWWAGRLRAPTVEELRARDPRPPIIYLRSFEQDSSVDRMGQNRIDEYLPTAIVKPINMMQNLPPVRAFDRWNNNTVEAALVEELSRLGPVLAIGDPRESVPLPGATRMYPGNDWKNRIVAEMKSAALVIVRPWTTEGILWEIDAAIRVVEPHRLIVVLWDMADGDYETFRLAARPIIELPPSAERNRSELIRLNPHRKAYFAQIPKRGIAGTIFINRIDLPAFIASLAAELGYHPGTGKKFKPPAS